MEEYNERRANMTRDRDLIIPQSMYAFVLDKTKGIVGVCVGPFKTSLAGTDQPVRYDDERREFLECEIQPAIKKFPVANDGSYLVLDNPAKDNKHPKQGSSGMEDLEYGRKVNIRGPVTFPLWAGQIAKVVPGHNLKSNEYLLVRVYNEEEAKKNWSEAVIKPQNISTDKLDEIQPENIIKNKEIPDLTTGKQLTIKGTEVSFYIPPTGIEVITEIDLNDRYVRKAVTLERLEYCILLDEDGNKRYVKGPAVVFPEPTETFITENNSKKFRAIELNEISGIYIKVIADYNENGKDYKVGEELFITGKDQMIYYPREEHAVIKYDGQEKHHAVAIPIGEARYVLNRLTGEISLKKGPVMFLPDPRIEVIVRRVIDPKIISVWFPGNTEALEYNKKIMNLTSSKKADEFITDREASSLFNVNSTSSTTHNFSSRSIGFSAREMIAGDAIDRKTQFTPPRTITIDNKYSGAVSIDIWTGYAVLIVGKGGSRRVVVGPKTVLLEYDESLGIMELSTGKPKSDNVLMKTSYLRITNNKVSDIITVETKDLVKVEIRLSYLVNFTGDCEKWFNAENYVKLLTQHLRSVINNAVKKKGIEEFYDNSIDIIRDTVLGITNETSERPGCTFKENGMNIYDVEVLDVKIIDNTISNNLIKAQRDVVSQTLELAEKRRELEAVKEKEAISQQISTLRNITLIEGFKLQLEATKENAKSKLAKLEADIEEHNKNIEINKLKVSLKQDTADTELKINTDIQNLNLERSKLHATQIVDILNAIQPELIATIAMTSKHELSRVLAENLPKAAGSFGLLTNKGGMDSLINMVKGTPLEEGLASLLSIDNKKKEDVK